MSECRTPVLIGGSGRLPPTAFASKGTARSWSSLVPLFYGNRAIINKLNKYFALVSITDEPAFSRVCVFLKSHPGFGVAASNPQKQPVFAPAASYIQHG